MKRCRAWSQPERTVSIRTFYGAEGVFFGAAPARSLSSEVKMNSNAPHAEPPDTHSETQNNGRRHVRDGAVAAFLLAVPIFAGYVALHPDPLRATPATPPGSPPPAPPPASPRPPPPPPP